MINDKILINAVRNKGFIVAGKNPNYVRKDKYGSRIEYNEYGNTNSPFGREIDHIIPVSRGGGDNLSNLQPLQRENNREKSNLLI